MKHLKNPKIILLLIVFSMKIMCLEESIAQTRLNIEKNDAGEFTAIVKNTGNAGEVTITAPTLETLITHLKGVDESYLDFVSKSFTQSSKTAALAIYGQTPVGADVRTVYGEKTVISDIADADNVEKQLRDLDVSSLPYYRIEEYKDTDGIVKYRYTENFALKYEDGFASPQAILDKIKQEVPNGEKFYMSLGKGREYRGNLLHENGTATEITVVGNKAHVQENPPLVMSDDISFAELDKVLVKKPTGGKNVPSSLRPAIQEKKVDDSDLDSNKSVVEKSEKKREKKDTMSFQEILSDMSFNGNSVMDKIGLGNFSKTENPIKLFQGPTNCDGHSCAITFPEITRENAASEESKITNNVSVKNPAGADATENKSKNEKTSEVVTIEISANRPQIDDIEIPSLEEGHPSKTLEKTRPEDDEMKVDAEESITLESDTQVPDCNNGEIFYAVAYRQSDMSLRYVPSKKNENTDNTKSADKGPEFFEYRTYNQDEFLNKVNTVELCGACRPKEIVLLAMDKNASTQWKKFNRDDESKWNLDANANPNDSWSYISSSVEQFTSENQHDAFRFELDPKDAIADIDKKISSLSPEKETTKNTEAGICSNTNARHSIDPAYLAYENPQTTCSQVDGGANSSVFDDLASTSFEVNNWALAGKEVNSSKQTNYKNLILVTANGCSACNLLKACMASKNIQIQDVCYVGHYANPQSAQDAESCLLNKGVSGWDPSSPSYPRIFRNKTEVISDWNSEFECGYEF